MKVKCMKHFIYLSKDLVKRSHFSVLLIAITLLLSSCNGNPLGDLDSASSFLQLLEPTFTSVSPGTIGNDNSPVLSGTSLPGASIEIFTDSSCSTSVGTTTADSGGAFSFTATVVDDTTTTFYGVSTSTGGDISTCSSSSIAYEEDSTNPLAPSVLTSSPVSPSQDSTPSIIGSAEANATINVYDDAGCTNQVGTGVANPAGNYSVSVSLGLNQISAIYAEAVDAAGNTSTCSVSTINYEHFRIVTGAAELLGTNTTSGSDLNDVATARAMEWSSAYYDESYYSYDSNGTPEKITVSIAGDYFVSVTIPLTGVAQRSSIRGVVRVNGTEVTGLIGESTYIRNGSAHSESSLHIAGLIRGLSINDDIEVYVQGQAVAGAVNVTGAAQMYLEYVSATRNIFTATANRTTGSTNLNLASDYLEWTEGRTSTSFTHNDGLSPEQITVVNGGDYMLNLNIPVEGAVIRGNVRATVLVNGVAADGATANQGYIRNASGHTKSSIHWSGMLYNLSPGDIITVSTEVYSTAGTITVTTGYVASIMIEEINTTNDFFYAKTQTTSAGTNWNTAGQVLWTTNDIKDAALYTHNTTVNAHQVTVGSDGDYLVVYSDSFTSTAVRTNPNIRIQINGTDVTGAECKTHYIRVDSGHTESSCTMTQYLRGLVNGDIISITTEAESNTGTVDDADDSILTIWFKG